MGHPPHHVGPPPLAGQHGGQAVAAGQPQAPGEIRPLQVGVHQQDLGSGPGGRDGQLAGGERGRAVVQRRSDQDRPQPPPVAQLAERGPELVGGPFRVAPAEASGQAGQPAPSAAGAHHPERRRGGELGDAVPAGHPGGMRVHRDREHHAGQQSEHQPEREVERLAGVDGEGRHNRRRDRVGLHRQRPVGHLRRELGAHPGQLRGHRVRQRGSAPR